MIIVVQNHNEAAPNLFWGAKPQDVVGFKYVFNFVGKPTYFVPDGSIVTVWPFDDTDEIPNEFDLHDIAQRVLRCSKLGKTLVHCSAGLNRSALVTGLAMMYDGWKAQDVIDHLRKVRSDQVLFNNTFRNYLLSWDKDLPRL